MTFNGIEGKVPDDIECKLRNNTYIEYINDEVIECQSINSQRCYTSQETVFNTYRVSP